MDTSAHAIDNPNSQYKLRRITGGKIL